LQDRFRYGSAPVDSTPHRVLILRVRDDGQRTSEARVKHALLGWENGNQGGIRRLYCGSANGTSERAIERNMDGGILALDAIHGIENCSLNNSGQPAREEWIRAGVYVRLQKNLVPVCYLVGMRRRCCRAANYEANPQSHTSFHKASLFWGK
jgi:hypothetical protein